MAQHSNSSPPPSPSSSPSPSSADSSLLSRTASLNSRLNAKAPEFVPRSSPASSATPSSSSAAAGGGLVHVYPPVHGHVAMVPVVQNQAVQYPIHVPVQYHHYNQQYQPRQQHPVLVPSQVAEVDFGPLLKNGVTEEAAQKIISQVEYYFSDLNLVTTDHLMRFISKDAEGYVPISIVASFKKIKAVINSNSQLASILQNSEKLVVSEDGKKVRRQHPLSELEMEELQSRIVIAENLPEDHCHQNLMKIFSAVGSVKTIRTCQPQTSNGGASSASRSGKTDSTPFYNKLHAFVEYESVELAEKAVLELNNEANWRSGLRVRSFVRHSGKSAQLRGKRSELESEVNGDDDGTSTTSMQLQMREKQREDPLQQFDGHPREHTGDENLNDREGGQKKGRNRGRGKGRGGGRGQPQHHYHHHHHHNNYHNNNHRGGTPPSSSFEHQPLSIISKQPPGPRMPDGTRGFSLGRGKPIVSDNSNSIA